MRTRVTFSCNLTRSNGEVHKTRPPHLGNLGNHLGGGHVEDTRKRLHGKVHGLVDRLAVAGRDRHLDRHGLLELLHGKLKRADLHALT